MDIHELEKFREDIQTKKNVSIRALPESGEGGLRLPEFLDTFLAPLGALIVSPFRDPSHPTYRFDCSNLFNMALTVLDKR